MRIDTISANLAFTMAEILIVLGIVGIIAETLIPSLFNDVTQKAFATAQDLAVKRIRVATDQMRVNDLITNGYTNDTFVDQFQKYIKTARRCDSSNLQNCFVSTFKTASSQDVNLSDLTSGTQYSLITLPIPSVYSL